MKTSTLEEIAMESAESWRPSAPCVEINALAKHIEAAILKALEHENRDRGYCPGAYIEDIHT